MYKNYDIPPITAANYKEAEKLIHHGNDEKYIDYANLEECLETIAKREKESDDNMNPFALHNDYDEEDWNEDYDWEDEDDWKDEDDGPPENCGGVPGYCHLLNVLATPKSQEYLMMKNWVSDDFDPKKFDKKSAQKLIDEYFYI